jgi:hypothetical protein
MKRNNKSSSTSRALWILSKAAEGSVLTQSRASAVIAVISISLFLTACLRLRFGKDVGDLSRFGTQESGHRSVQHDRDVRQVPKQVLKADIGTPFDHSGRARC